MENKTPRNIVASLVYRCDLQTQFSALTVDVPAKPDDDSSHRGRLRNELCGSDGPNPGTDLVPARAQQEDKKSSDAQWSSAEESWNDMLCRSAWDHFCRNSASDVFFSMAPRLCGFSLGSLDDVLSLSSSQSVPEPVMQAILDQGMTDQALKDMPAQEALVLDFQVDDGAGAAGTGVGSNAVAMDGESQARSESMVALSDSKDVFFFRLFASSLHRRKRARTDVGSTFDKSQVIVQRHKIREVGWG